MNIYDFLHVRNTLYSKQLKVLMVWWYLFFTHFSVVTTCAFMLSHRQKFTLTSFHRVFRYWLASQRDKVKMLILPESTVVPWWAQETSGSPAVPSSHRWILYQLLCTLHSTELSNRHSENTYWGCHSVVPRNSQLQLPPQCGCPKLPLGSVQYLRSLKDILCMRKIQGILI